jgi:hypothetical protein
VDTNNAAVIIVISDKFSNLKGLNISGILTYSDFLSLLNEKVIDSPIHVYFGQGITQDIIDNAIRLIERNLLSQHIIIFNHQLNYVDKEIVHKEKSENVAISTPIKIDKNRYSAELLVNDSCSEMMDHVTGIHIQGMLMIEAARQMMMASVELGEIADDQIGLFSYVLKNLNIEYFQYLYPVSAQIFCQIDEINMSEKGLLEINLHVEFFQAEQRICRVSCLAQGYRRETLKVLETRLAKSCIREERRRLIESIHSQSIKHSIEHNAACVA